jgi:hypothetical protein
LRRASSSPLETQALAQLVAGLPKDPFAKSVEPPCGRGTVRANCRPHFGDAALFEVIEAKDVPVLRVERDQHRFEPDRNGCAYVART